MSDKLDQRSKIGEWIGAAFDAMLHPPQRWEGSIHMAWGAINSKVVEICRKSRTDGIDGIIRDLEAAGFRAYYDRMSQCMEVAPPGPLDLRGHMLPNADRQAVRQLDELTAEPAGVTDLALARARLRGGSQGAE